MIACTSALMSVHLCVYDCMSVNVRVCVCVYECAHAWVCVSMGLNAHAKEYY